MHALQQLFVIQFIQHSLICFRYPWNDETSSALNSLLNHNSNASMSICHIHMLQLTRQAPSTVRRTLVVVQISLNFHMFHVGSRWHDVQVIFTRLMEYWLKWEYTKHWTRSSFFQLMCSAIISFSLDDSMIFVSEVLVIHLALSLDSTLSINYNQKTCVLMKHRNRRTLNSPALSEFAHSLISFLYHKVDVILMQAVT